jgi:phosphoribosyl 1,2-cyclic phosphodiesterase
VFVNVYKGRGRSIAVLLTVLGSGSSGNATLISYQDEHVLLDAGLSYRGLKERLEVLNVAVEAITAIFVTHAHGDHVRSVASVSRRHGVPVYTTTGTRKAWGTPAEQIEHWKPLTAGKRTSRGALSFLPFTVPHDANETLAFRIDTPEGAIGFATDIGCVTSELVSRFQDCRVLVIESNHSVDLLRISPYGASLRTRIGSDQGHLSNEALAAFCAEHLGESVQCVVLSHLSRVNNTPAIAEMTCREALDQRGRTDVQVLVTEQKRAAETIDMSTLPLPTEISKKPNVSGQHVLPFM